MAKNNQFSLLLYVRWQLFLNSLRTRSRDSELAIGLIGFILLGFFILGGSIGFFFATLAAIQTGELWVVTMLLWAVFLIWQLAPILFEGYSPGLNFREIARYPISFRLYYLLNCAYGLVDPAAITSLLWLAGIWTGVATARPDWAPLAAMALLAFVILNLFCNRIVLGLFERFQSSRKGRERMVVFLLIIMLAPQAVQIVTYNWTRISGMVPSRNILRILAPLNRITPPGLVVESLSSRGIQELGSLLLLLSYCLLLFLVLRAQSRKVYQGEIYSEAGSARTELKVQLGWSVPGVDDIFVAIAEKELRYVRQNSRLMVLLVYPMVIFALLFFTRNPAGAFFRGAGAAVGPLGMVAAFLLLSVSNLGYNIFGMDQDGFGRWLLSPVSLEKIIAAKNLVHGGIFFSIFLLVAVVTLAFTRISLLSLATITTGFLALLLVQFSAGNIVSAHWPKKIDLTRMSSRMASNAAGFASLLVTVPAAILVAVIVFAASFWQLPWLPLAAALLLLAVALRFYFYFLGSVARYLYEHLEEIETALSA